MNPLILRALTSIPDECFLCKRGFCDPFCEHMNQAIKNFAQYGDSVTNRGD